jgi:hypothetical protein
VVFHTTFPTEEDDLKPVINPQHEGRCCREILKEIQNLTYLCPDGSCLADLKQDIENLLTNFKQHIPSGNQEQKTKEKRVCQLASLTSETKKEK